ncbi:hypothetical protein [Massilia sp. CF038]|uniref:hypothetical protein n=1 Tax=Massilia sp. CF038 TaxID=1881045 RepID=UPI000933E539|nr:hypothetical protein [Massilia sp. CF038]
MKLITKSLCIIAPILLSGCFTIKLDNVVRDTADVSKSAYQSLAAKWDAKKKAKTATVISHSYIGNNNQTVTEVKQLCETEAAQKLRTMSGLEEVRYTVIENEIVTINGAVAANCKLGMDK